MKHWDPRRQEKLKTGILIPWNDETPEIWNSTTTGNWNSKNLKNIKLQNSIMIKSPLKAEKLNHGTMKVLQQWHIETGKQ